MCSNRCAKPVRPGASLAGPDVVPEVHRHDRQPMVLDQDHLEPVGQRGFLVGDLQRRGGRSRGGKLAAGRDQQRAEESRNGNGQAVASYPALPLFDERAPSGGYVRDAWGCNARRPP